MRMVYVNCSLQLVVLIEISRVVIKSISNTLLQVPSQLFKGEYHFIILSSSNRKYGRFIFAIV